MRCGRTYGHRQSKAGSRGPADNRGLMEALSKSQWRSYGGPREALDMPYRAPK